ncbi:coiled-coil domain-containing protein 93 isoform X2 [Citrus clementina]|uniref:coiled-coil domain-containing protein 93 isoform X2 n=1 Tax=Citrus clementina TaxID=85681 RepID=UPI000CED0619|nr:coiled-coil domain-containing protein 93 isoform X2 [Citrus x clementina]
MEFEASQIQILDLETPLQSLRDRIDKAGVNNQVEKLISAMESVKAVERQESELQSNINARRAELEADITELNSKLAAGDTSCNSLSDHLSESLEKLDLAKMELAARLREIVLVKRQLGEVPSHSELIHFCILWNEPVNLGICRYERRFSELYAHIQEKHRQTQKYYATYNALLEIKELMLKETSLLNSISSQFQDAIISTAGRMKLIDSMEKIAKGSQQKLEKVQVGLRAEQKTCDVIRERHAAAIAEQRRCHSLLKTFQCAKNERLRSQSSV